MWSFSKRLAALCCASAIASTAMISADNADCCYNYNDDNYGNSFFGSSWGECSDSHWGVSAEFLYWKTHLDNLPISRCTVRTENHSSVRIGGHSRDVIDGQDIRHSHRHACFKWRPGVRLNLGYKNPECSWDFNGTWTYLHSHAKGLQRICRSEDNSEVTLVSAWPTGLSLPMNLDLQETSARARGRLSLNYHVLELALGHTYNASDCFVLRPHVDLKVAWIDHRFGSNVVRDVSGSIGNAAVAGTIHERVHAKRRFTGVGPQLGFDVSWDVGSGFNVFAKASSAILYARPKVNWRSSLSVSDIVGIDNTTARSHKNRHFDRHLVYNPSMGVGLGWNSWLCDNSYLLSLKLGWEHHLYFDQNNFHRSVSVRDNEEKGNLALYGLTAALGLDF